MQLSMSVEKDGARHLCDGICMRGSGLEIVRKCSKCVAIPLGAIENRIVGNEDLLLTHGTTL